MRISLCLGMNHCNLDTARQRLGHLYNIMQVSVAIKKYAVMGAPTDTTRIHRHRRETCMLSGATYANPWRTAFRPSPPQHWQMHTLMIHEATILIWNEKSWGDLRQRSIVCIEPGLKGARHGDHLLYRILELRKPVIDVGGISELSNEKHGKIVEIGMNLAAYCLAPAALS